MSKFVVIFYFASLMGLVAFSVAARAADSGFDIELSRKRCDSQVGTHGTLPGDELYQSDVHWGYSFSEMQNDFWSIYQSGKRLAHPAEFNSASGAFQMYRDGSGGLAPIKLTDRFLKNVTLHIEEALENGFANFVFFPDMGHSHLYFEHDIWKDQFQEILDSDAPGYIAQLYEKMLADPNLFALYHTAEQLEMMVDKVLIDDSFLQFRYWNRNPMGQHNETGLVRPMPVLRSDSFNTVRELPGKKRWGGGFEVSSSKNACFAYRTAKGKTLFFDIGLIPLQRDPSLPLGDQMYWKRELRNTHI